MVYWGTEHTPVKMTLLYNDHGQETKLSFGYYINYNKLHTKRFRKDSHSIFSTCQQSSNLQDFIILALVQPRTLGINNAVNKNDALE